MNSSITTVKMSVHKIQIYYGIFISIRYSLLPLSKPFFSMKKNPILKRITIFNVFFFFFKNFRYGSMTNIVDHVFPPTSQSPQMALDYSSFTFWREPLPNIIAEEESSGNPVLPVGIEPETEVAKDDNNIEKIPSNHDCNSNANKNNDGELNTSDTSSPSSSSSQTTIVENVILETDSNQIVH